MSPKGTKVPPVPGGRQKEDRTEVGPVPGTGRSPGGGHANPLQSFCLENPMDRGAWQATLHGMARVGHDLMT